LIPECGYIGVDVNERGSDSDYKEGEVGYKSDSDSLTELEGDELEENLQMLQAEIEAEMERLAKPSAFEQILKLVMSAHWKKAEEHWKLGYNGQKVEFNYI
jgi:hypothetical protein